MLRARILLLVTVVIWGWTFVATKVCLQHLEPLPLLALRFAIAIPVLFGIVLVRGVPLRFARDRRALALGSLVFAVHFLIQIEGLRHTSATATGWIIAITPLVMAALAFVVLGERISRRAVTGILVATAGILILVARGNQGDLLGIRTLGDLLILASAHTWALYTITIRNVARSHEPIAVTFAVLLPATLLVGALALIRGQIPSPLTLPADAMVALLFLAVFGTALAHWFWQIGVARVGAAEAGVFLFLEPLATTALAVPYLGEQLTVGTVVGGLLVLAGVGLAQRRTL